MAHLSENGPREVVRIVTRIRRPANVQGGIIPELSGDVETPMSTAQISIPEYLSLKTPSELRNALRKYPEDVEYYALRLGGCLFHGVYFGRRLQETRSIERRYDCHSSDE